MGDENTSFKFKEPGSGLNKSLWDSKAPITFLSRSIIHIHFQDWTYLIGMLSVCILGTLSGALPRGAGHRLCESYFRKWSWFMPHDLALSLRYSRSKRGITTRYLYYVEVNCEVSSSFEPVKMCYSIFSLQITY